MAFRKITDAERTNNGVTGLPDIPGLETRAMQQRIDGLGNLAIDAYNEMADVLNSEKACDNIQTNIVNPKTSKTMTLGETLSYLLEAINTKIVSVESLPETQEEGTIYLIQGKVTVE